MEGFLAALDRHQNAITLCKAHRQPTLDIQSQSICYYLCNPSDKVSNIETGQGSQKPTSPIDADEINFSLDEGGQSARLLGRLPALPLESSKIYYIVFFKQKNLASISLLFYVLPVKAYVASLVHCITTVHVDWFWETFEIRIFTPVSPKNVFLFTGFSATRECVIREFTAKVHIQNLIN